ncbi:MAG: L,D-transpeptidase family protein [Gammaproteobacteria bacterium]|nr:L,D-transpeptidase family protein [Gammaproteobacteria bacterium]
MTEKLHWLLIFIMISAAPISIADDDADREALRHELEHLAETGMISTGQVDIAGKDLLVEIYGRRNYLPAWNDQRQIHDLIAVIRATEDDGLDPSDYHLEQIEYAYNELLGGRLTEATEWAPQDLILTDSLIRLGYHQLFGKVNPYTLDPNWNFRREMNDGDPATAIQDAIDSPSLAEHLKTLFPRGWVYEEFKAGLARYREIAASGGWPIIPEGPTLRPGATDDRLPILARRLAITGDLESRDSFDDLTVYDEFLLEGVKSFQARHGIDVDGIIGPASLRMLNVSAEMRVKTLEINLERARWVLDDIEDDFILVNIAGFEAYLVQDKEVVWQTKVQVGSQFHQSPVFRDEMKYLVLNPTWTVPYSIATKEMLPQIKSDPDYFAKRDFDLKDRNGKFIDPNSVDWSQVSARNFGYWLVQRPGPGNALGRVKFMFPNDHAVYLHDTPSKYLFNRAERAFSHGCIRVENPFDFAEQLLGKDGWTQEKFQDALDSEETQTVMLSTPLPVLLLYWTAVVRKDGTVVFYNDVYERDRAISDALDEPFMLDLPGR